MSVVNKMLQDLEARQADPNAAGYTADYQAPSTSSSTSNWIVGTVVILLLAAVGLLLWDKLGSENTAQSSAALSTQQSQGEREVLSATASVANEPETVIPEAATVDPGLAKEIAAPAKPNVEATSDPAPETAESVPDVEIAEAPSAQANLSPAVEDKEPVSSEPEPVFEMRSGSSADPSTLLRQTIQMALENDEKQQAIQPMQELLAMEPDNTPLRKRLAALLFGEGALREAEQVLLEGIEQQSSHQAYYLMLARLYARQGNPQSAFDILSRIPSERNESTEVLAMRASLAEQIERFSDAETDYSTLLTMEPRNPKWWLGMAVVYERMERQERALNAYHQVLALDALSEEVNQFVQQRIAYLAGEP